MDKALVCCHLQPMEWLIKDFKGHKNLGLACSFRGTSQNSQSETQERNNKPVGACPRKQIIIQWDSLPYHKALFTCVDTYTEQSPCWPESQETQNLPALQVPIVEGTGAFPVVFQVSWVCAQDWQCWRSLLSLIRPVANFTNTEVQTPLSQRPYYETWEVAISARVCISTGKKIKQSMLWSWEWRFSFPLTV